MNTYPVKIINKNYGNFITVLVTICECCNLNCFYCYNNVIRSTKVLDLYLLQKFIYLLYKQTKKNIQLVILGGEPTLHNQIVDLCNFVKNNSYVKLIIYTNFHKDLDFFRKLNNQNVIFKITYHYKECLQTFIDKVLTFAKDALVDLTLMYEPNCYQQILDVYAKLNHNKLLLAVNVQLIMNDLMNKNIDAYNSQQMSLYYNSIEKDDVDEVVVFNDGKRQNISCYDMQNMNRFSTKFWKCYAGIEYIEIDINGNVYACIHNDNKKLINIYDDISMFKILIKPVICKQRFCPICWPITKERILK